MSPHISMTWEHDRTASDNLDPGINGGALPDTSVLKCGEVFTKVRN